MNNEECLRFIFDDLTCKFVGVIFNCAIFSIVHFILTKTCMKCFLNTKITWADNLCRSNYTLF